MHGIGRKLFDTDGTQCKSILKKSISIQQRKHVKFHSQLRYATFRPLIWPLDDYCYHPLFVSAVIIMS